MLKQQARLLAVSVFLLDLSLVAFGFLAAYWLRSVALPFLSPEVFPAELYPLTFHEFIVTPKVIGLKK